MNVKLKVLRKVLEEAIDNIDAGNSNHSDDELDDIISSLTKLNRGIKRISKRKDKVAASPRGKELLEKQLNNIKVKKEEIIKEANKNIEVFKRFQEAARLNPNLTYAEFVKSLN